MKILVTGANGFVGRALCPALAAAGHQVVACVRQASAAPTLAAGVHVVVGGAFGPDWRWPDGLTGVDAVVHLAARVHVLREHSRDPLHDFRTVNVEGTRALLDECLRHDVKRVVYLSSIKAAGDDADPYGQSKLEAEAVMAEYGRRGLETVVVRPPLVYGPGVGGNFLRLLRWLDRGVPLPLAGIDNRRSLVFIGNLNSALQACLERPQAAGQAYAVCDGDDVSTPELLVRLANALHRPAHLFRVPVAALRLAATLVGRGADFGRLCGSLTADMTALQRDLSWRPPYSMNEGLAVTAAWYLERKPTSAGGH